MSTLRSVSREDGAPPRFRRGDVDGVCGQLLGVVLSFVVIANLASAVIGLDRSTVAARVLPGCAAATAVGVRSASQVSDGST